MENNLVPFLKIELWLYRAKINGRSLTRAEIEVLSFLWMRTERGQKGFCCSIRHIAQRLNYSISTIDRAVRVLKNAGLIINPTVNDVIIRKGFFVNADSYKALRNATEA